MEDNNGGMKNHSVVRKKKRSLTCRRPKPLDNNHSFSKISSDDIPAFDTNPLRRKEFSLSHCISRAESIAKNGREIHNVSWKNSSQREEDNDDDDDDGGGVMINGESKKKVKVKVKISGFNRLVHGNGNGKSSKSMNGGDAMARSNQNLEESSDDCDDNKAEKEEEDDGSMTGKRKTKRAPKKRVFDSDDDDNDDEIRFIEKLRNRNNVSNGENSGKKTQTADEEEKEEEQVVVEPVETTTLTNRQRALAASGSGSGRSTAIEFPDGLPPTSRRKKENLSATEQQLKKAEAAQRRKVLVEKAARESEAEAIRKILGQDSSRKKREDKIKKQLDEKAKEKAAHEERASTSYIRTIMGPNGTTVSFPIDKVPSLFDPKPVSYPPPRENCAGPSCTNPYRYRDSKTNVPLCSLKCYKAVQEKQTGPV